MPWAITAVGADGQKTAPAARPRPGRAALLIGAASAPQAAISGFHGPYTIPGTATAAQGVRKEKTMRHHQGTRLARCARRLGVDRNPLRRRTDRIEAVIRIATMILLLAAVPLAMITAGRQADHLALSHVHAQQAADHQVTAVLLQQAPPTRMPDPYSPVQMATVLARWQPPGQVPRTGQVPAPACAGPGSTVSVWLNASGAVTSPPPDHQMIAGTVVIAAIWTGLITILLVLGASALTRRVLDRQRIRAWDAEWRATGPRWSGHRS